MGATGRWRGVPFSQEQESVGIVLRYTLSKRALPALANPDTKDQFDSCMKNWSEWGIRGECVHVVRAVLLLERRRG